MVNGLVESLPGREIAGEPHPQEHDPEGFKKNREPQDGFENDEEVHARGVEKSGLDDLPSPEGNPPSHEDEENGGKSDDAQPADLEKEDRDDLSGDRKVL